MEPDLHDPNNNVPGVTPEDEWDDSWDAGVDEKSKMLPGRKKPGSATLFGDHSEGGRKAVPTEDFEDEPDVTRIEKPVTSPKAVRKNTQVFEIGAKGEKKSPAKAKPSIAPAPLGADNALEREAGRRRRNPKGERNDWGKGTNDHSIKWMLGLGMVLVVGMVVLALFVSQKMGKKPVRESQKSMFSKLAPVVDKFEAAESEEDPATVTEKLILKEQEARSMVESYLKAASVEEIAGLVINPEQVVPLLRENWKATDGVEADWKLSDNSIWQVVKGTEDTFAKLVAEKPDFTEFTAYFVYVGGEIKMDWKATTGYGTASFAELAQGQGDSSEVRVWMAPADFYTFSLPDSEYVSFRLSSPEREQNLWGYLRRDGELFERISPMFTASQITGERNSEIQVTLELKEGPEDSLANQWIIEDVRRESWIDAK